LPAFLTHQHHGHLFGLPVLRNLPGQTNPNGKQLSPASRFPLGHQHVVLILDTECYEPLARHGRVRALFAAFIVSGIWHLLLAYAVLGRWGMSVVWGAFFFVQPLLILLERRMKVRRWRPTAARGWTLWALAVPCPLIVEPTLQIIARILGAAGPVPWTAAMIVLVVVVTVFPAAVSLMASSPSIRGHKTKAESPSRTGHES
jgi:hypothetical protein